MGIWIRRLLALVAAAVLVVAAVTIRRGWDDDGAASSGDDPGSTVADPGGDGDGVVACIEDLAEWCRALDLGDATLRIEPWSVTAEAFEGPDAPDAWVTFSPLDELATGHASGEILASSALAVVARSDRSAALLSACDAATLWRCVGDNSGAAWTELGGDASWGKVLPGLPDPSSDALGALTLGAASSSYFGTTDYGSTEIDADPEFFGWFTRLARAVPDAALDDPLALLLRRPSAVGVVGTTAQHHAALASGRATEFPATYPGPMARADVVVTRREGGDAPSFDDDLASALLAAGWDAPSAEPDDGLPSGRALVRLHGLWKETRS